MLFIIALTVNRIAHVPHCKTSWFTSAKQTSWTGPALPQMKYTTINPPVYISSMLASRCLLCWDWATVVTWVTALCLKPPCEDLLLRHTTHNGGIFGGGIELRRKSRTNDLFCFVLRQKHLDEGQRQDWKRKIMEWIWSCFRMRYSLFHKGDTSQRERDSKVKTKPWFFS